MNRRIAFIAALEGELKPLVHGWDKISGDSCVLYRSREHAGIEMIAIAGGIGRTSAAQACQLAFEGGELSCIVSIGWAGALSCGMKPGLAHIVHEVIDASTGERYQTASRHCGPAELRLVTTKRIAGTTDKRKLAESYGAVLVDMEAATIGRLARVHDIPFYCLKAVSDEANEKLPDMNPFLTAAGEFQMARFTASVMLKPMYWPALIRMGKNSNSGAAALAVAAQDLIEALKNADNHATV